MENFKTPDMNKLKQMKMRFTRKVFFDMKMAKYLVYPNRSKNTFHWRQIVSNEFVYVLHIEVPDDELTEFMNALESEIKN